MASGGQALIQQSLVIEGRIKTLINNDLKAICKAYGEQVSGNKIQLQHRCINVLKMLVRKGDSHAVNEFSARVSNHGLSPIKPAQTTPQISSTPQSTYVRPVHTGSIHLDFKQSPFYEKVQTVLRPHDLPEMPQNRHTVKANLILTDEQARRMVEDPSTYKLMLYCAQIAPGSYSRLEISFPPQIEVKVNDDDVRANFKGLKNKAGSTKPAEITKMVRIRAGYANKLSICYALTHKRYAFTVILIRHVQADALVQKIRGARVFTKARVLEEMKLQNADPDIAATSIKMSLKDPVSTLRITTPIRSTICKHNQCFDAAFFMQLQEQAPTWTCPICSKTVTFDSLCVDKYFEDILQSTLPSVEQVTIEPDGEWRVETDDKRNSTTNTSKGAARAAYDDDFDDDDIVEVAPPHKPAGVKNDSGSFNAFNTPPLSSREPSIAQSASAQPNGLKRPAAVIDLTLSDDDDEPPRPVKRVTTSSNAPVSTPQMHTPSSLMDRPTNPPNFLEPSGSAFPQPPAHNAQPVFASDTRAYSSSTSPFMTHRESSVQFGRASDILARNNSIGAPPNGSGGGWGAIRSPSGSAIPENVNRPVSVSQSPPAWATNPQLPAQMWRQDDARQWPSTSGSVRLPPLQNDTQQIVPHPMSRGQEKQ